MIQILLWIVLGGFAWLVLGTLVALAFGAIIRDRDCCPHPDTDDLMRLVQPENVAPAERDLRVIERSWLA